MKAGQLRHRLALQRYEETQNPNTGAITKAWVNVTLLWAKVEGIQGREFIQSSAEQAATTWRITTRYIRIEPAMRLKSGDTIFNIKAVLPNNNQFQLVLMCETGVNQG